MHVLVVALSFPSPTNPYRGSFIGQQVRLLCERTEVDRVTVLSPTTRIPWWLRNWSRVAAQAALPERYELIPARCEVFFPRYAKPPGDLFLTWTAYRWSQLIDRTILACRASSSPVSLIHANGGGVSGYASICVARQHGLPAVVTYQGSEVHGTLAQQRRGWRLCRESFVRADVNLPVSSSLEEILRGYGQPTGRCEVLLRGVDRSCFYPGAALTAAKRVLFVGRIEAVKGAFDLLTAWAAVLAKHPAAELVLVGRDHTRGAFIERAKLLGIHESIRVAGELPAQLVADCMRESRVFCLPSHAEGTPNCVMEALSCGLPVVSTRVGGIPDVVQHGSSGLLVNSGDSGGLATALCALLDDTARCVQMGRAAQAFADRHLDARRSVARLIDLYADIIARRRSASATEM